MNECKNPECVKERSFNSGCLGGMTLFVMAMGFAGFHLGGAIEQHKANEAGVGRWISRGFMGWNFEYGKQ